MADIVFIEGLTAEAVIGVYEWEKRIKQTLLFDLEMEHDNRIPAQLDDLTKTLDYEAISNHVLAFCDTHVFELIETLAEQLSASILESFKVPHMTLTVRKPGAVPAARSVGVKISRGRN